MRTQINPYPQSRGGEGSMRGGLRHPSLTTSEGILPITKSNSPTLVPRWEEWSLPGKGEQYRKDCGELRAKGCLEEHSHQSLLDGTDTDGKAFVRVYKSSCNIPTCPVCYESWAAKEGNKIDYRIKQWKRGKPVHIIVSPNFNDFLRLGYDKAKKKAYKLLHNVNCFGGCLIFHPFRQNDSSKEWYFSPHFHIIGFGWLRNTAEEYAKSGWVIRNVGIRWSVFATAHYQLTHCGIATKRHSVVWFGRVSYNNFHCPKEIKEKEKCPLCGNELVHISLFFDINTLEIGDHWINKSKVMRKPLISLISY